MPTVFIARLDVTLRGIPAATAQTALADLGPALAAALTARGVAGAGVTPPPAARLEAAPLRLGAAPTPAALTGMVADQIAGAVSRHLAPKPTG